MQNIYSRLLEIPEHIESPNYYELLGIQENTSTNHIEQYYKDKIQNLQKLGNNPKYKDAILFLKGELRNAYDTLTNSKEKLEYDALLLARRIVMLQQEASLLKIKGYLLDTELHYLRKRGQELKIPKQRLERMLQEETLGVRPAVKRDKTFFQNILEYLGVMRTKSSEQNKPVFRFFHGFVFSCAIVFFIISIVLWTQNKSLRYRVENAEKQAYSLENKLFNLQQEKKPGHIVLPENTPGEKDTSSLASLLARMSYIPEGFFFLGSQEGNDDEKPVNKIYLDGYYISRYEVTNREYLEFVKTTNYPVPYLMKREAESFNWDPLNRAYPKGMAECPVVLVSWKDATEYCKWLSQKYKCPIALPTEAQWEKAARGLQEITFPWGNEKPDEEGQYRANYAAGINGEQDGFRGLAPVGSFPLGRSFFGCFDMAGNVCEWCQDSYDKVAYQEITSRNPLVLRDLTGWPWKVLRGGSWSDSEIFIRSTYRFATQAEQKDIRWGFRYVVNLPKKE